MDMKKNRISRSELDNKTRINQQLMMSDLLSAISETEYPQYILDAIEIIRNWINDVINRVQDSETSDMFNEFFGDVEEEEPNGFDDLFARLRGLEEFADVAPNLGKGSGKPDTLIISLGSGDYESGIRTAIDHAAVFNRPYCKRVWIISDSFIFGDTVKFIPHVDALAEQGITLRFILVTAWGWVELPLSEASTTKNQFLWKTPKHDIKHKRRK